MHEANEEEKYGSSIYHFVKCQARTNVIKGVYICVHVSVDWQNLYACAMLGTHTHTHSYTPSHNSQILATCSQISTLVVTDQYRLIGVDGRVAMNDSMHTCAYFPGNLKVC